ncbi:GNAT family N-acetyltransferase [uncultured Gilvimarinus sp.]|uniref:GNAT family N-acetyltransferase n=1 Tax=uncultured Gilvimarinus sp. TaxID=1689143 RepID=UPI0030DADB0D
MITLELFPVTAEDRPFLQQLYASTRWHEVALAGLATEQAEAFLTMQFNAQSQHYRQHYPRAQCDRVVCDGVSVGRLYVDRSADDIRIVDIALLPEHRQRGIGTRLLQPILAEARQVGVSVSLHVDKQNSARQWYRRLGFVTVEDRGVYDFMRYRAVDPVSFSP